MVRHGTPAGDLDFEPEVFERIRLHRKRSLHMKLTMVAPLMLASLALLALVIYSVATGTASVGNAFTGPNGSFRFLWWVVPLAMVVAFLLLAARGDSQKLRLYDMGSDTSQKIFSGALEGVSSAVGMPPPPLVVLDVPTANSIAFLNKDTPTVGVTVEALLSDLGTHDAEAMMAHELAHIITGDIFVGSSSKRMRRISYSLVFALVAVVLLSAFVLGVSWVVPFIVVLTIPFYLVWLAMTGKRLYSSNDLLADSVAAKITYNPAALAAAIRKVGALYTQNREAFEGSRRYMQYMFVTGVRPEVEMRRFDEVVKKLGAGDIEPEEEAKLKADFMEKVERRRRVGEATISDRLANLKAIELGHWIEFEGRGP